MIRAIQHNCARSYTWNIAALEMGVDRKADLVLLQEPPGEKGRIRISHPAYEIRQRMRVWMAVRKGSGLATDKWTDLSRGANDDDMVTDVKRRGEKMTTIINVYDQRDVQTGERRARKLNWHRAIRQGGGTIMAGDMNAHSQRWYPRCREQRDATFWEEIIDEHGLEIGNDDDRPTHHWARNSEEGESTIDLTLATQPITQWTTLGGSHATGSNHEVIEWEFNVDKQEEADHVQVIGWNLAAMSQEDEEAAEKLWRELERERAHLGEECTGDDVEREAEWCQETLSKVLDAKAKKIRICARSKRWWNGKIKERRCALGREKRRGRRSEAAARAEAELQKSIRQSKSRMWNDKVQNLRGGKVWRAAKFTNPRAGATVEALTDIEGKQANTIAEKEEMLRGESFPLNDGDQYYELPPAGEAHERITEQSVERALFSQSVKKAPSADKLSNGAIRRLWKWDKTRIVGLTKAAVGTGHHKAIWKRANWVVIRKPGKEDYTQLKSYRMISPLSCMGKVVEKVVAELLSDEAERRALLRDGQFGSRKKRSAIDAAAIMVDTAHAAWKEDNITGVLLMDIKAAFPSVARGMLIHAMKAKKIDGDLI